MQHASTSPERRMPVFSVNATTSPMIIKPKQNAKHHVHRISTVGLRWRFAIVDDDRAGILLLAPTYNEEEEPFLDSTGCNKMIMIVTDGATETAMQVFQSRNWSPNNVSTCHAIEVQKIEAIHCPRETSFAIVDTRLYLYDWKRIRRPQTYPLDVMR